MQGKQVRAALYGLLGLAAVLFAAVLGYVLVEDLNWLEALWLAVVSVSTVGYGDVVPRTLPGRLLTLGLILTGAALFAYVVTNFAVYMVEGQFRNLWGLRKMQKEIEALKGHVVVCGAGRVGQEVIRRLQLEKAPFVVIEVDPTLVAELREKGVLVLEGSATDDEMLERARVAEARAVITALPDDAANLLVTLSVKNMNPRARVVARANGPQAEKKLRQVGADNVISPAVIGGCRMALSALKPISVAFVESLMDTKATELEIEEVVLPLASPLVGKTLRASRLKEDFGLQILVIKRGEQILANPAAEEILRGGDLLIVFGAKEGLENLEKALAT